MTRTAGDHGATASECAGPPMKFTRIARHHFDILHVDPQGVGHELRKNGEVPLALCADTRRASYLAARLDVARHADANVFALRTQTRLIVADEFVVSNELDRLFQRWEIVSAVVHD